MIIFSSESLIAVILRPIGISMLAVIALTLYSGLEATFWGRRKTAAQG